MRQPVEIFTNDFNNSQLMVDKVVIQLNTMKQTNHHSDCFT